MHNAIGRLKLPFLVTLICILLGTQAHAVYVNRTWQRGLPFNVGGEFGRVDESDVYIDGDMVYFWFTPYVPGPQGTYQVTPVFLGTNQTFVSRLLAMDCTNRSYAELRTVYRLVQGLITSDIQNESLQWKPIPLHSRMDYMRVDWCASSQSDPSFPPQHSDPAVVPFRFNPPP